MIHKIQNSRYFRYKQLPTSGKKKMLETLKRVTLGLRLHMKLAQIRMLRIVERWWESKTSHDVGHVPLISKTEILLKHPENQKPYAELTFSRPAGWARKPVINLCRYALYINTSSSSSFCQQKVTHCTINHPFTTTENQRGVEIQIKQPALHQNW